MKNIKVRTASVTLAAALLLAGCNNIKNTGITEASFKGSEPEISDITTTDIKTVSEVKSAADIPYEFDLHAYNAMLEAAFSDDYRESFFNLCDALREGKDTFECSSQEVYDWCMDEVTLNQLFPVACMTVTGKSSDGSTPFEDGTGHIYYKIPVEQFIQMETGFEEEITEIINDNVKSSYSDFEKCLALYDYMVSNYKYDHNDEWYVNGYGANYFCFQKKIGICESLGGIYAYLLMQCGVDAIVVSNFGGGYAHAWTFVTIDGKNYHIDPTWGLKDEYSSDAFYLDYFMMTDNDRENAGYLASELSVPLLPYNYAKDCSEYSYIADDDTYRFPMFTACTGYNTDSNVIYYSISGEEPLESQYE